MKVTELQIKCFSHNKLTSWQRVLPARPQFTDCKDIENRLFVMFLLIIMSKPLICRKKCDIIKFSMEYCDHIGTGKRGNPPDQ